MNKRKLTLLLTVLSVAPMVQPYDFGGFHSFDKAFGHAASQGVKMLSLGKKFAIGTFGTMVTGGLGYLGYNYDMASQLPDVAHLDGEEIKAAVKGGDVVQKAIQNNVTNTVSKKDEVKGLAKALGFGISAKNAIVNGAVKAKNTVVAHANKKALLEDGKYVVDSVKAHPVRTGVAVAAVVAAGVAYKYYTSQPTATPAVEPVAERPVQAPVLPTLEEILKPCGSNSVAVKAALLNAGYKQGSVTVQDLRNASKLNIGQIRYVLAGLPQA